MRLCLPTICSSHSRSKALGRVYIDQDLCTGDGLCEEICPAVFYGSDDGLYYVRDEGTQKPGYDDSKPYQHAGGVTTGAATYSATLADAVQEASEECPGECIFIERDDGSWTVG